MLLTKIQLAILMLPPYTTLTGNISEINSAYASSGINGLGNEDIIISIQQYFHLYLIHLMRNTTGNN